MPRSPVSHPITFTQGFLANPSNYPGTHGHPGVDIRSGDGDKWFTCVPGFVHIQNPLLPQYTVTALGQAGYKGYGAVMCVDWGQADGTFIRFLYGHGKNRNKGLDNKNVGEGQLMCVSGNTGHSTGYHLHFEMRHYKVPHARYWDGTLKLGYGLLDPIEHFFKKFNIT